MISPVGLLMGGGDGVEGGISPIIFHVLQSFLSHRGLSAAQSEEESGGRKDPSKQLNYFDDENGQHWGKHGIPESPRLSCLRNQIPPSAEMLPRLVRGWGPGGSPAVSTREAGAISHPPAATRAP